MKLNNHSTIESIDSIALNDKRLILHNGVIVIATIKNIISNDEIEVEIINNSSTNYSISINKNSIYEQRPFVL